MKKIYFQTNNKDSSSNEMLNLFCMIPLYNMGQLLYLIKFFLLLFIFFCIYKKPGLFSVYNNLGDYRLYEYFKKPQISIIVPNIEFSDFNISLLKTFLDQFRMQTLENFEVVLSLHINKENIKTDIKLYISNDTRFKIYDSIKDDLMNNLYYLIGKSNGRLFMIMSQIEKLQNYELEKFWNKTKGKIKNIFTFIKEDGIKVKLIRTKIVKNLIDDEIKFKSFDNLINYISKIKPKLNYISIAFCPDDYYTFYTYVAMLSILDTKLYSTFISFYILVSIHFKKKNMDFLTSLYDDYEYFNLTFLFMDNRYEKAYISRYLTTQTYFRFSLAELIPYLNRIIYLDVDTIIYKDLTDLFNINFNGKMILGQVTYNNNSSTTGKFKINNGVLLLNLKKMRKKKLERKVLNIINNGYKNEYHDQALVNKYLKNEVGIFPLQFHIRPFNNIIEIKNFIKKSGGLYDIDYYYMLSKYPTIIHYVNGAKPIYENTTKAEDWWYYARKTKYFKKKFPKNITKIFSYTH